MSKNILVESARERHRFNHLVLKSILKSTSPRLVRWQLKLEPEQVLKVTLKITNAAGRPQDFLGRISISRITVDILCEYYESKTLVGQIFEVSIEPAGPE